MSRTQKKGTILTLLAVALAGLLYRGSRQSEERRLVLSAPNEQLRQWGRHFIVGFDDFEDVLPLVAKGAVGGIFLRSKNVRGKSVAEIATILRRFQDLRYEANLPPLLVAADQEGGIVSRLSPPLPTLPPLSLLIREANADELDRTVANYAELQAEGLARLGVNLNFAPVVDLSGATDLPSRLGERSLGSEPETVGRAARIYADALERFGVAATLKHFPGLGRYAQDTHHGEPVWKGSIADLENRDWIPFREIAARPRRVMMLGHARLEAIDPDRPVSLSKTVIQELIRERWGDDGLLVTDDFGMAPIKDQPGGVGGAAVEALNAGVDLILVANGLDGYYRALAGVLEAEERSKMDHFLTTRSERRLDRFFDRSWRGTSLDIANVPD